MIIQTNQAARFVAFFTASGVGKTGLTVTVDVYNAAGTKIVTDGAASEVGGGIYNYTLAGGSVSAQGDYIALFKTSDTTVDSRQVPSMRSAGDAGVNHLDANTSATAQAVWDFVSQYSQYGLAAGELLNNININVADAQASAAYVNERLTDVRATKLDNVAQVGSAMTLLPAERTATAGVVKANIEAAGGAVAGIKAKTDNLPSDPASNTTVNTRLAASGYTAPDNAAIVAAKTSADAAKASADQAARPGAAMTLTSAERTATADALLDRVDGVEAGLTLRQHLRIAAAVLFGKAVVSGNHIEFKRRDGTTTAVAVDFTDAGARPASTIGSV